MNITRIALIGAPNSGKSSTLKRLRERQRCFASVGYIEEVATSIFSTLSKCNLRESNPHLLQALIAQQQLAMENTLSETLQRESLYLSKPLLLSDRAVFDALVYSDHDTMLDFGLDIRSLAPYDLVIYLRGGGFHGTSNNPFRRESPEEISALEVKTRNVYINHSNKFIEIGFHNTIEEKTSAVAKVINTYIKMPLFKESSDE